MNRVNWFLKCRDGPFPAGTLALQRSSALSVFSLPRGHPTSWKGTPGGGRFSSLERRFR